jgi:hypothetical protein
MPQTIHFAPTSDWHLPGTVSDLRLAGSLKSAEWRGTAQSRRMATMARRDRVMLARTAAAARSVQSAMPAPAALAPAMIAAAPVLDGSIAAQPDSIPVPMQDATSDLAHEMAIPGLSAPAAARLFARRETGAAGPTRQMLAGRRALQHQRATRAGSNSRAGLMAFGMGLAAGIAAMLLPGLFAGMAGTPADAAAVPAARPAIEGGSL